jgi:tetratricopeptide (TPR) repeat protein
MNRILLTGIMAFVTGLSGLMAQTQPAAQAPAQPAAQAPPQQKKQPMPKSQGEVQALQAIFSAKSPDDRILNAEALIAKYADTDFKDLALYMAADACRMKNDSEKQIVYLKRVLEVNPRHFQAMIDLASALAVRTKEFDLDRDQQLAQVEKYANAAIPVIQAAVKPNPNVTDDQWDKAKKDLVGRAHEALGLANVTRKKYDAAIAEFKIALDMSPEPAYRVRMAQAYIMLGKWDDAVAQCDQVAGNAQAHPQVKQVAQSLKDTATKAKASGARPPSSQDVGGAIKVDVKNP